MSNGLWVRSCWRSGRLRRPCVGAGSRGVEPLCGGPVGAAGPTGGEHTTATAASCSVAGGEGSVIAARALAGVMDEDEVRQCYRPRCARTAAALTPTAVTAA